MTIFGSLVYPEEVFTNPLEEKKEIYLWFADIFNIEHSMMEE